MPDAAGIERILRELIHRERLANTVSAETAKQFDALFAEIERIVRKYDPTAVQPRYRVARVQRIIQEVQRKLRKFAPELERAVRDQLAIIGRNQAVLARDSIIATLGATGAAEGIRVGITQARLRAILNTDPFQGRLLKEHVQRLSANTLDRVRTAIRTGMTQEESIDDIVRRVRGKRAGFIRQDAQGRFVAKGTKAATVRPRFVGGALSATTRDAEAIVRTAVTHISNVGMMETFKANADVVSAVQFVATLDARTTEICAATDGETWPLGSDEIRTPPLHYNCRSILVPEVDWDALGLDPPPEGIRAARDADGKAIQVPSSTTYEGWLRDQPKDVQERVLGQGKAAAFRSGKVTLKDVVRDDYSVVPLAELNLD